VVLVFEVCLSLFSVSCYVLWLHSYLLHQFLVKLQAMEALIIHCLLGHALGLGGCSAALEDAAFKVGAGGGGGMRLLVWGVLYCDVAHCAFFQRQVEHALGLGGCSAALEDTAIQVVLFGGLFQWMCIVACGGLCCGLFQGDVVHHGSGWRMAMEALTLYWPLGRALGLVGCSAALVDAAFKAGTGRRGVCGVGSFSVMLCVLALWLCVYAAVGSVQLLRRM
jgi:hypothetical protein